ncbi:MAG: hypothetical protein ACI841_004381 [Planctomycetota bacterium]|jgi:hypothetical protein
MEGAFRDEGFDLDFEKHAVDVVNITSLAEAREWVERAFHQAIETIRSKSPEEFMVQLPAGPVLGGAPRLALISAIEEHTAHPRGALAVYSRLQGHTPPMPYGNR